LLLSGGLATGTATATGTASRLIYARGTVAGVSVALGDMLARAWMGAAANGIATVTATGQADLGGGYRDPLPDSELPPRAELPGRNDLPPRADLTGRADIPARSSLTGRQLLPPRATIEATR
jgi:hypothetical protein